jgi:hypothetical protein
MKVVITHTSEPDDKEAALKMITDQLKNAGDLEKNTVGLMFCHYECVLSGVAEYIAANLPFPVVGVSTTLAGLNIDENAEKNFNNGQFRLIITVISADDVEFSPVVSDPITPEQKPDEIADKMLDGIGRQKLGIMMLPHILLIDPDDLLQAVTKRTNAQIFGGTAVDNSPTYIENCFVIADGVAYRDRAVYLFMNGNIDPHFASIVVNKSKYFDKTAVITASKGNEIISLDGRPVTEFLSSLGFNLTDSKANAINAAVMIVDDGDGDVYGRSMMYLTPENHLFVGGKVKTGATVSIAKFKKQSVFDASAEATRKLLAEHPDIHLALVSSCESRHILLGFETFEGENLLKRELRDIPFALGYAGGEICPSPASTPEKPVNRIFNQSYCICVI